MGNRISCVVQFGVLELLGRGVSAATPWPRGLGDRRTPRPFSSQDLRAFVMQMAAGG
jgi:hypothetical protein